jgi:hypothetical protein
MKKEIYNAYEEAIEKTKNIVNSYDGEVAVIGVGNTCGVKNKAKSTTTTPQKLKTFWEEYEQQEDDDVSYMGLMAMLGGGQSQEIREKINQEIWKLPR